MTKIPWTNETWNPVVGCTKIAAGCKNCYAERFAYRLQCMGKYPYHDHPDLEPVTKKGWTENIICNERALEKPLHWKKLRMIFVCSMGDLFHEKVPVTFIDKVLSIIEKCQEHTFQILTKRPERIIELNYDFSSCPNLWLGTSISTQKDADKNIPLLLKIPAAVRFVSIEPLLEEIYLPGPLLNHGFGYSFRQKKGGIDWVIVGSESGQNRRPCKLEWIDDIIRHCKIADIPIFLKQIPLNGRCVKDPAKWPDKYQSGDLRQYPK